jgi:hypothetical protein
MTTTHTSVLAGAFVAMLTAGGCYVGGGNDSVFGSGADSAAEMTTTAGDEGRDGSRAAPGDEDEDEGEDGEDTTTSGDDDGPGVPADPCVGLDLVFVVNNTQTMMEEQLRLQTAAGLFVEKLAEELPDVMANSHIGVLTTDDHRFVATTSACDVPYASGTSYITFGETMSDELGCSLEVGIGGDPDERPAQMLLGALADEMRMPGAFHHGFVRDEALLVVVIATDEDDRPDPLTGWGSEGAPADWVDALVSIKGGHERNVVVLSLVGTPKPNACPDYQWNGHDGAEIATRIIDFTESFSHGAVGDLCALEYASYFLAQVPSVAAACNDFI